MRAPRTFTNGALGRATTFAEETAVLRQRLAEAEAELESYRSKHEWLQAALDVERHGRQMLEATISARYQDTVVRLSEAVSALIPDDATVLVISKGDQELLKLGNRRGWHFPQNEDGDYAGYYPADSALAIAHLQSLIAKGGEFLLVPNTAFWWLEHYRDLETWLTRSQTLLWSDEWCAIFKLSLENARERIQATPEYSKVPPNHDQEKAMICVGDGFGPSRLPRPGPVTYLNTENQRSTPGPATLPTIVCFPIIDWDFRFQRPQHLLSKFALAGHKVFYLSHQLRKSGTPYQLRSLGPGLWEVSLRGPRFSLHQGVLDDAHCEALAASLADLKRACMRTDESVAAVVHSPFWWPLVKQVADAFSWPVMYDCMDYHSGFATYNPVLKEQEDELLSRAQLVIASSAGLEAHARGFNPNVLLVRNGCDYDHFAKVKPKRSTGRPVIGYYGAIAEWFDSDLVADLAESRPEWNFILVGSTYSGDVRRLLRLANVSLPGEKAYAEIPGWLAKFDVVILPFKRSPLTEAANPVKAYEILASGKSLVSVPLPEVVPLAPLVRVASDVDGFQREIQSFLSDHDQELTSSRQSFARENTWAKRFSTLHSAFHGMFPSVSVNAAVPSEKKSALPETQAQRP